MRTATVLAAFAVSSVAAFAPRALMPRDYPACSLPCLANANLDGCSSATDLTCLCKSNVFLDTTTQCIYNSCTSASDIAAAVQTAESACKAAGVPLTSTYTPTQSRSATSSGTGSKTVSGSTTTATGSVTVTTTASASGTSSAAPTSSSGAAMRLDTQSGVLAMVGAAVIGAIAF